jgi:peptidyl-prolyl cis-trans isomerase D
MLAFKALTILQHNKVDLGYFGPNQMVKPFNDFVFNNGIGNVGLVEKLLLVFMLSKLLINKMDSFSDCSTKLKLLKLLLIRMFTQATKFEMEAADKILISSKEETETAMLPAVSVKGMEETLVL